MPTVCRSVGRTLPIGIEERPGTNAMSTSTPSVATQKLTMNTASNASATSQSSRKAARGPASAPAVSMARCTPNARPWWASSTDSEISASRGAVRMPLPIRSTASVADSAVVLAPARSRKGLHTADRP